MKKILLIVLLLCFLGVQVYAQSTLALQEKCVEGAKKLVLETGGCDQIRRLDNASHTCQYRCHYNKKLDRCFIRWDMHTIWDTGSNIKESLRGTHTIHIDLSDVFENRLVGQYDDSIIFGECTVGDKKCNSLNEFEMLVRSYMGE